MNAEELNTENRTSRQADLADTTGMENKTHEYDPFARDAHSESEIQSAERREAEQHPGTEPAIPGNLPPERIITPVPEHPVQHEQNIPQLPVPEIPSQPGREYQQPEIREVPPETNNTGSLHAHQGKEVKEVVFPAIRPEADSL